MIRHAVSLDERRWFFRQNLMSPADRQVLAQPGADQIEPQDLVQVWFPGVHCDVGGGYDVVYSENPKTCSQLWRLSFNWMCAEAEKAGLRFDKKRVHTILKSPDPSWQSSWKDLKHESLTARWWPVEYCPKQVWNSAAEKYEWHIGNGRSRQVPSGALIDQSILERLRDSQIAYAPPNLSSQFCSRVNALPEVPQTLEYTV